MPLESRTMPAFHRLIANASGKVRRVNKGGREYLVAPVRMIVPGVLNGSKGALYYPPDEIARNYDSWNGMPMVVGHPKVNGTHVSAREPSVEEAFGIGVVYNSRIERGALVAEGWFDVAKLRAVEPRILSSLQAGRKIELSTGLFTDNIPQRGVTRNGRAYDYVARNYRPDHLAILVDEVGACSVNDGCGVLVNQRNPKMAKPKNKPCSCGDTCSDCKHRKKEKKHMPLTANQRETIVNGLIAAGDVWSATDIPTLNALEDTQLLGLRKQSLALGVLTENAEGEEEGEVEEEAEGVEKGKGAVPPVANNRQLTPAEFYDMAPPDVKEVLREAVAVQNQQKAALIQRLTANVKDKDARQLTVNKLAQKSISELREIAELIPTANSQRSDNPFLHQPNYAGATGFEGIPTVNQEDRDNFLPLPKLTFGKDA